jgi:RimJ/RimL family protein N-acetyltransferase
LSGHRVSPAGPAYLLITDRLRIRCWSPLDAPLLDEAIAASLDHLRPWMPWARLEPLSRAERVQLLRRFRGQLDLDVDAAYGVFSSDERTVVGATGLHPRVGPGAREIGFWVHAAHVRRGYATEIAAALTRVAFEHEEVERVEIHCAPANVASAAVARKLGFSHEATLRRGLDTGDPMSDKRDSMIFTLFADEYPRSPAASARLEAYDVAGGRLL